MTFAACDVLCRVRSLRTHRALSRDVRLSASRGGPADAHLENYYDILGVTPRSTGAEIRKQYRALQQKYHPDVAGPQYREMSAKLNIAYNVLTDADAKLEYDGLYKRAGYRSSAASSQVVEGLVGPLRELAVPLQAEELEIGYDAAVDWLQQWGNTITFGCEVPFATPLQVDRISQGVRIAFLGSRNGASASIGDLYLEVDEADMRESQTARINVTRVALDPSRPMPGERAVLRMLRHALKSKRSSAPEFKLTGFLATALSASLGFLPLISVGPQETAYDGYRIPQRCDLSAAPGMPHSSAAGSSGAPPDAPAA